MGKEGILCWNIKGEKFSTSQATLGLENRLINVQMAIQIRSLMEKGKKAKSSLSGQHSGEENTLSKPWLAPNQRCNLRLNHRKGCRRVQTKCAIYSAAISSVSAKMKLFHNVKKLACCQTFVCRIGVRRAQSLLPCMFPVSFNTFSPVALIWPA